jgi:hypothetical protein
MCERASSSVSRSSAREHFDDLNIYTHVVDASHRKAVEAVEERLFFELDPHGPKFDERGAHDFADKR